MDNKIRCKWCGNLIRFKEDYCYKCGKKIYSWSKTNWIIIGVLIGFSIVINLFSYFYYGKGSLTGFVIITLVLTLGYVYLWYENSPERVEAKRRAMEERRMLDLARRKARAEEIGRVEAREHIHRVREERKFEDRMIKKMGWDKPVLEGFLGNIRETFVHNPRRKKR